METLRSRSRARARVRARLSKRGFTLVELMVVVLIISIMAAIATPAMRVARDDRLAFDYARRIEQLIHRGRTRAAGRGAAHLFIAQPTGASRGEFQLFEALDGTTPANAGPNPVSSCKLANEWNDVITWVPGLVSNNIRIVDGFDLNSAAGSINVNADIQTAFFLNGASVPAIALCVTPSGTTYAGQGTSVAAAIADMQVSTVPFNSFAEVRVTRNQLGSPIGIKRRVLVAGGAAPRIKSE